MGVIKVCAKGQSSIFPDKITINFSFCFKDKEYITVLKKGTDTIKDFKNILKNIKVNEKPYISDKNIITNGFTIKETYKEIVTDKKNEYGNYITKKEFDSFVYNQKLSIELDYVLEYLEILLNEISDIEIFSNINISFGIKDIESLKDEAMADAVSKCTRKANRLAEAIGKKIDEIKEITYDMPTDYISYNKCSNAADARGYSETVKNKISLCDVLNPEPIIVTESIICIFKIKD